MSSTPTSTNYCCESQSELKQLTHTWTIDNLTFRYGSDEIGKKFPAISSSSSFASPDAPEWEMNLRFYPIGYTEANAGWCTLVVTLSRLDSDHAADCLLDLVGEYKFSIIDTNGAKRFTTGSRKRLFEGYNESCAFVSVQKWIKIHTLLDSTERLMADNKVTILFELTYLCNAKTISPPRPIFATEAEPGIKKQLINSYAQLLASGKFSDAVLFFVNENREIPVHKAILAARSPVFEAMFTNDTQEKQDNKVNIVDFKSEVFRQVLRYIYAGHIPEMGEHAAEFLAAADKYQLDPLKQIAESALCEQVSAQTASSFLLLADMHNAEKLKKQAHEFIQKNTQETFKQLMDICSAEELNEAFRSLALKIQKDSK